MAGRAESHQARVAGGALALFALYLLPVTENSRDRDALTGHGGGRFCKGYRLHAMSDDRGRILEYRLTDMRQQEKNMAFEMLAQVRARQVILADGNYDSSRLYDAAESRGAFLFTPLKRTGDRRSTARGSMHSRRSSVAELHRSLKLTNMTRFNTALAATALLLAASLSSAQSASPRPEIPPASSDVRDKQPADGPASDEAKVSELTARLADVEKRRAALDAEIETLRAQIAAVRPEAPAATGDPYEEAKAKSGRASLVRVGSPVTMGNLRITLESFTFEQRCFSAKKRFNVRDTGPIETQVGLVAAIFKVENLSEGRVAQPFREGNMFGGQSDCSIKDSWGNLIRQSSLQGTELEIAPCRGSAFAIEGERVHPKEIKRFLISFSDPEVANFRYLVLSLTLDEGGGGGEGAAFYIAKDEAKGMDEAVKRQEKNHTDEHGRRR